MEDPITDVSSKIIDQITRMAFLAACGDNRVTPGEFREMGDMRAYIERFLLARKAIEHYDATGNFSESQNLFDGKNRPLFHMNTLGFGGIGIGVVLESPVDQVMDCVADLMEILNDASASSEKFIALVQLEAKKITDRFEQEVAIEVMALVCCSDDDFTIGEKSVIISVAESWDIQMDHRDFSGIAWPVLLGEELISDGEPLNIKTMGDRLMERG